MGLFENMKVEPVSRLALRQPVLVKPEETVREAVLRMRDAQLGCVIVVDDNQRPIGMFTESMLTQLVVTTPEAVSDPVSMHATNRCPWVAITDPVHAVLEAMEARNVRFLCVVDNDGRVAGLTGQKGLMEYVAEHFPGEVMVQRIGQKPYLHSREGA